MRTVNAQGRAEAAVATLESNRTEAKALFGAQPGAPSVGEVVAFPRSKTFRWLLGHPIGRWVCSAVITAVLARLPLGRFVRTRLLSGRT